MALARDAERASDALHGEMKYAVNIGHRCAQRARVQDRAVRYAHVALRVRIAQVVEITSREVIEYAHAFATGNKRIDEMTSDEACPAGNKDAAVHGERAFCLAISRRVGSSDVCACPSIRTTPTPCRPPMINGEASPITLANSSTTVLKASRLTMRGEVTSPMR